MCPRNLAKSSYYPLNRIYKEKRSQFRISVLNRPLNGEPQHPPRQGYFERKKKSFPKLHQSKNQIIILVNDKMKFFNECSTIGSLFFLIAILLVSGSSAAPRRSRRSSVPAWHKPCGEDLDTSVITNTDENFDEAAADGLRSIALQHQLTLTNYLNSDYEFLYERVRLGVQKHQYIPNWIPGKKDVAAVKRLQNSGVREVSFMTVFYLFSVSFYHIVIQSVIWKRGVIRGRVPGDKTGTIMCRVKFDFFSYIKSNLISSCINKENKNKINKIKI